MGRRKIYALAAGVAAVCALAGCGTTKTITKTVAETRTVTSTRTMTKLRTRTRTRTRIVHVTATVTRQEAAAAAAESEGPGNYSGNGQKNLGTIVVAQNSTIEWTDDSEDFGVVSELGRIAISSEAKSGSSYVAAGTYSEVTVIASGNWTIKIVPR